LSDNPYLPPKAELREVAAELPARPRAVTLAIRLVLGGVLLQVLGSVWAFQQANFQIYNPVLLAVNVALYLLLGFLCHQIARRKSWPRIVLLIFTLVTFARVCMAIGAAWRYLPGDQMLDLLPTFIFVQVLPMTLNLFALQLLFFSSGKWFR
jgi:hypothetical protein